MRRTRSKGAVSVAARGRSMFPLIRPGERVILSGVDDLPAPGEVWAFVRNGRVIVHRVIGEIEGDDGRESVFVEIGDHAFTHGAFRKEDCVGRVVGIDLGRRVLFLDRGIARYLGGARTWLDRILWRLRVVEPARAPFIEWSVPRKVGARAVVYALMVLSLAQRLTAERRAK